MQYFLIIFVLVLALGQSDLLLGLTFAIVIVGFIFGVSRIAKEK
jgi:hypothetical protein